MQTCKNTHVFVVFTIVYKLIITKLSANIELIVGFITVYSNCDGSLKERCYGNRFVALVAPPSSFCALSWHSTTVGKIAKRMRMSDYHPR